MFKIGDKVVCKYDFTKHPNVINLGIKAPNNQKIYKIRNIVDYNEGYVCLLLEEIINSIMTLNGKTGEPAFDLNDFEKVDESFAEGVLENIEKQIDKKIKKRESELI